MGTERAVGWAALDTAVLQWVAGGGSPELGAAVGPAEMRTASLELARRVDALRDLVADGTGIAGVTPRVVAVHDTPAPAMPNDSWTELPPAAATGPEVVVVHADSYGTGSKCLRCGRWATPGTECVSPEAVAARHQATIDKAFEPAKPERATPPADPWPMVCERIRNLSRAYSELVHELDALRKARP